MNTEKITPETEVSTSELACVLGITARYIRQLAEDGQLEKVEQGRFNLCESVQKYVAFASKDKKEDQDIKVERGKNQSEMILKTAKAKIAKLEAEELEGKMHRSEDVASMTEDLIYTIRASLLSLPGRLAVDVSAAESSAEAATIIRKEVFEVMDELSKYRYDPAKYEERVKKRMNWEVFDDDED